MKTDQRGHFPFSEPLSGYEILDKAGMRAGQRICSSFGAVRLKQGHGE